MHKDARRVLQLWRPHADTRIKRTITNSSYTGKTPQGNIFRQAPRATINPLFQSTLVLPTADKRPLVKAPPLVEEEPEVSVCVFVCVSVRICVWKDSTHTHTHTLSLSLSHLSHLSHLSQSLLPLLLLLLPPPVQQLSERLAAYEPDIPPNWVHWTSRFPVHEAAMLGQTANLHFLLQGEHR